MTVTEAADAIFDLMSVAGWADEAVLACPWYAMHDWLVEHGRSDLAAEVAKTEYCQCLRFTPGVPCLWGCDEGTYRPLEREILSTARLLRRYSERASDQIMMSLGVPPEILDGRRT